MIAFPTALADVLLVEPRVIEDERGWFMETWHAERFAAAGIDVHFVQDNHSCSRRGVVRGMHYQVRRAQGNLVRVVAGEVYDVAVDLRRSSATFGRSVELVLSAASRKMLWIPPGFAHGFLALSERAELAYKCTDFYDPASERTLLWNDPQLAIRWPIPEGTVVITSAKDRAGAPLAEAETYP